MKRYPNKAQRDYVSGILTRERNGLNEIYCYNYTEFVENLNAFIENGKSNWTEEELRSQCEHFIDNESRRIVLKS